MAQSNFKSNLQAAQVKRRDALAKRYFGDVSDSDFMVAEKGRNGIVRIAGNALIKATHGGAFRKPTFSVLLIQRVYGLSYDQSIGAEAVTLYTPSGEQAWNVYDAGTFTVRLLEMIAGEQTASTVGDALGRTRKR